VRIPVVVAALVLAAVGCSDQRPTGGAPTTAGSSEAPTVTGSDGAAAPAGGTLAPSEPFARDTVELQAPGGRAVSVPVYVADEPRTRRRGLMERDSLPAAAGMLFTYQRDSRGGFYMKNTEIPLSIAFYDVSGRILEVLRMQPCTAEPCQVYDPGVAYRGALEVNQGYFERIGLTTDWTVELPASSSTGSAGAAGR
jgi:uncharacterized membrane protein (UPF0127 family)